MKKRQKNAACESGSFANGRDESISDRNTFL